MIPKRPSIAQHTLSWWENLGLLPQLVGIAVALGAVITFSYKYLNLPQAQADTEAKVETIKAQVYANETIDVRQQMTLDAIQKVAESLEKRSPCIDAKRQVYVPCPRDGR